MRGEASSLTSPTADQLQVEDGAQDQDDREAEESKKELARALLLALEDLIRMLPRRLATDARRQQAARSADSRSWYFAVYLRGMLLEIWRPGEIGLVKWSRASSGRWL